MNLQCVIVLCVFLPTTILGGWLKEFVSPKGLDIGNGLTLHLQDNQNQNLTFFERHAVSAEYGSFGVRLRKAPQKDAVQLQLYQRSYDIEGRDKKDDEYTTMTMLIGYKVATLATLTISVLGALVMKALAMAKIALITSGAILAHKLLSSHKPEHHYTPIEIEPEIAIPSYSPSGIEYHPSAATNFYAYNAYNPSAVAASNNVNVYDAVEAASNTSTSEAIEQATANPVSSRRHDKRKHTVPLITVHRYTIQS